MFYSFHNSTQPCWHARKLACHCAGAPTIIQATPTWRITQRTLRLPSRLRSTGGAFCRAFLVAVLRSFARSVIWKLNSMSWEPVLRTQHACREGGGAQGACGLWSLPLTAHYTHAQGKQHEQPLRRFALARTWRATTVRTPRAARGGSDPPITHAHPPCCGSVVPTILSPL